MSFSFHPYMYVEKYDLVGKLLRKGEQPTNYEDEEDDTDKDTKASDTPTNTAAAASSSSSTTTTTTSNVVNDNVTSTAGQQQQGIDSEGIRKRDVVTTSSTEEVK